jgi:hypothetical protein
VIADLPQVRAHRHGSDRRGGKWNEIAHAPFL